jgi:pyridoxine 5'-phosphate synthase PdxJ
MSNTSWFMRALFSGFAEAVREMKALMQAARA